MSDKTPIRQAAKAVHKSRAYVRKLIDTGDVAAYRTGGTDEAPWLSVDLDELRRVVDRLSIYVPPIAPPQRRKLARSGQLHPAVAGMRIPFER